MRIRSSIVIAGVIACLGCSESSTAPLSGGSALNSPKPFLPGEQQPLVDVAAGSWAIYPEGAGQILQQTFTPSDNGWLGYLELPVGCSAGVLLNVKIRDGLNGPILYEANVLGLPEFVDGTFQLLQVYNPAVTPHGIKIKKNHEYAFELAAFPGPAAVETTCGIARGPSGNTYGGGRGYYQDPINGPLFLPIPNGAATDDEDLPFRTLVR